MLKQLIQRLLDSRTTPAEAAHSAMPNVTEQVIATTDQQNWGIVAEGVAPYDCYLMAQGRATSDVSELRAWNKTADIYNQVVASRINQTQGCCVPVAKGNSWQIFASNRDVTVARYISLIGGGDQALKLVLQGGGLCLKHLYSSLRRSSFLTRRSGYANNPFLVRRLSLRSLGMEPATKILCLQETGLYALPLRVALGQECFRKQIYRDVCCKTTTENTRRLLFKLVKEKLSTSILQVLKQRLLVFGLFPQLVANRFVLGGAL